MPGKSPGSIKPWRRHPIERSQVRARATGGFRGVASAAGRAHLVPYASIHRTTSQRRLEPAHNARPGDRPALFSLRAGVRSAGRNGARSAPVSASARGSSGSGQREQGHSAGRHGSRLLQAGNRSPSFRVRASDDRAPRRLGGRDSPAASSARAETRAGRSRARRCARFRALLAQRRNVRCKTQRDVRRQLAKGFAAHVRDAGRGLALRTGAGPSATPASGCSESE